MARVGSRIGNEDYDNQVVDVEGEIMERPEDSVETQLIEVDNETRDADVLDIDADQLDADTAQLERHADNVAASLEDGGMDETAARATEIAVEDISGRWNLTTRRLGTENFASGTGRVSATRLGLESIIDTIKGAWERFLEWMRERFQSMKDVWRKYVNAGKSFKKRAQKLRERVNKLNGSPDTDAKVSMKKIWMLACGEKVNKVDYGKMGGEKLFDAGAAAIEMSFDAAEKSWTSTGELGNAVVPGEKLIPNGFKFNLNGSESKFNKMLPAGIDRKGNVKIHALPGALLFVYKKTAQTGERFKGVAGADKFAAQDNILYAQLKLEDVLDQEAPVLSVDEMHAYLDDIIGIASGFEKFIQKYSSVERKMTKLETELKRAIEKEGKAGGETAEKQAKMKETSLKVEVSKINLSNAIQQDRLVQGSARNICQGGMIYVTESMRQYKD